MPEKNTNRNGHKQLSPKWLPPDLYDYIVRQAEKEGLSQTAIVVRAIKHDKKQTEFLAAGWQRLSDVGVK